MYTHISIDQVSSGDLVSARARQTALPIEKICSSTGFLSMVTTIFQ